MENGKEKSSDEQSPSSEISNSNEFLQISPHSGGLTSDQFDLLHEMILTKHEDLSIRYKETFACLEQTFEEVNLLREENLKLRAENLDLSTLVAAKEKEFMSSVTEDELVSDFSQFGLGAYSESERERATARERSDVQKVAATDSSIPTRGSDVIPKVISVRSNAGGPAFVRNANHPQRLRLVAKSAQGGGKEKEVELEVYNQGMVKTELCNKWEETGECPYGERCQFAHGVQELRPVIRHPRYKTEICRMILNGGTCPYGHRCHFRHALDPTEEQQVVL